jgi:hypothetical protein
MTDEGLAAPPGEPPDAPPSLTSDPNPGLETFYRRHGFDVLAPGEGLDLSHLGVPSHLSSGPDHQVFTHWQLA